MEKKGIRAQSQLITTILLIVLVLAAIIIVWAVVNNLITESAEEIGTQALTTRLEIKEAKLWVTGGAEVIVKREPGEGDITSLKFIFYNEDGESVIIEETEKIPKEIETKIYDFGVDEYPELYNINKVSVVPMFGKKSGIEFSETKPNTDAAVSELVSWWKFDGNARDSVGGNEGGLEGDAKIENGVLVLDGEGDFVDVGHDDSLEGMDELTISALIYPRSATIGTIIAKNGPYGLVFNSNQKIYGGVFTGTWATAYGDTIISLDSWNHVAITYDGNNILVYLNRVVDGSIPKTGTLAITGAPLQIGYNTPVGFNDPFNGSIDDVMIFNKALTEDEINAVYNNQLKE